MDDDFKPDDDPADLSSIATEHEAGLRRLHKQLRRTGCQEAAWAVLAAADSVLAAARALAAEFPPGRPSPHQAKRRPMYLA